VSTEELMAATAHMRFNRFDLRIRASLTLAAIELVALLACVLVMAEPAAAQLDDRFPFMDRRRRYDQQSPSSPFDPYQQQRQAPVDASRAPAPRRPDVPPTVNIVVLGDSMADWLAYGLEDAFGETPEIGVTRKHRTLTGLIRSETRDAYDWPQQAREMLSAEKPDFVVVMVGLADRRAIRERVQARSPSPQHTPAQAQTAQPQAAPGTPSPSPAPAAPQPAPQADAEAAADSAPDPEQPNIALEAPGGPGILHEFRSDKWVELYGKRFDEMVAAVKTRGVPVFWVGLPAIRGARAMSDVVYLNDFFRGRAEKAGVIFVDVWDGFVDEVGNFAVHGPDFEGQTRRLRAGDGVHFTRAGARKLAHYVEREIRRVMLVRTTPVATPIPQDEPETRRPTGPAARPIAGPVVPLTATTAAAEGLLGGSPVRASASTETVAIKVLVKGEPVVAPPGRADDFVWPRRDVETLSTALPPDPVVPAAAPPAVASPTAPARPAVAPQAALRPPPVQRPHNPRPAYPRPLGPSQWAPQPFFWPFGR
jgi:uncharacterized protein